MSCLYTCDGCGKVEVASVSYEYGLDKPTEWYQRVASTADEWHHACSLACAKTVEEKAGSTTTYLEGVLTHVVDLDKVAEDL